MPQHRVASQAPAALKPVAALQVRAVRLRRDRIAVALEHKVLVYNFADLRLLHSIETLSNPGGLLAMSPSADQTVLACPGLHVGQVGSGCLRGLSTGCMLTKGRPRDTCLCLKLHGKGNGQARGWVCCLMGVRGLLSDGSMLA